MSHVTRMSDGLVTCPFNSNHKIRESGIQYHIVRCMRNYPNHVTCPFNAIHRVLRSEYARHIMSCPNRNLLQPDAIRNSFETQHGDLSATPIHVGNSAWNTEEEDWSADQ